MSWYARSLSRYLPLSPPFPVSFSCVPLASDKLPLPPGVSFTHPTLLLLSDSSSTSCCLARTISLPNLGYLTFFLPYHSTHNTKLGSFIQLLSFSPISFKDNALECKVLPAVIQEVENQQTNPQNAMDVSQLVLFALFRFWPHQVAYKVLVLRPGMERTCPIVEAGSPNHQTPREFPVSALVPQRKNRTMKSIFRPQNSIYL